MYTHLQSLLPKSSAAKHEEEYRYITVRSAPPKKPAGRTKFRETRHPVYRGVRRRGQAQVQAQAQAGAERWVCEVRIPGGRGSRLWLGTFATAELVARAHDAAVIALSGSRHDVCLNFADSAWLLPPLMPAAAVLSVPELATTSVQELKDVVAEAIEAFRRCSPDAELILSSLATDAADNCDGAGAVRSSDTVSELELESEDVFRFGGMVDARAYYASLAQGLLIDPPDAAAWWEDVDHDTADIALWSY